MKGNNYNFRRNAEAKRYKAAQPRAYIKIPVGHTVEAVILTIFYLRGAETEQRQLTAMGMAAQGKAGAGVFYNIFRPRFGIMLKHNGKHSRANTTHGLRKTGTVRAFKILLACDNKRGTPAPDRKTAI